MRDSSPSTALPLDLSSLALNSTVILGLSGGRDSMALLHALREQRPDLTVVAAHVSHGLRPEATQEAATLKTTVETWAALASPAAPAAPQKNATHSVKTTPQYKKPAPLFFTQTTLTPPPAGNLENWGRTERYAFFQKLAAEHCAQAVLTAHHQNDDIESIFLHLLRGTRVKGLSGMSLTRPLHTQESAQNLCPGKDSPKLQTSETAKSTNLLRPLLFTPRQAIDAYVAARQIPYLEDPSNADPRFNRNFLRHQILPALAEQFPDFGQRLQDQKNYWLELQNHLEKQAHDFLKAHLDPDLGLARAPYRALDLPVRLTVLERWYHQSTQAHVPDAATLTRWDKALLTWPSRKKTPWGPHFLTLTKTHGKVA